MEDGTTALAEAPAKKEEPAKRTVADLKRLVQERKAEVEAVLILPIEKVVRWPGQPRKVFRKGSIENLAKSIDAAGQKTPIEVAIDPQNPDVYLIVDGERRWRARHIRNGKTIRAIIVPWEEANKRFISSVVVNFNHEPHTRYETALAIKKIYEMGEYNHAQIGEMFGRSTCWVSQHLSITKLHSTVIELLNEERPANERLKFCTAILLTTLPQDLQLELAKEITGKKMSLSASRHYVEIKAAERGFNVGSGARPERRRGSLGSLLTFIKESLPFFLAVPNTPLRDFLTGFSEADLARLLPSAEDSVAGLQSICATAKEVLAVKQVEREQRAAAEVLLPKKKKKKHKGGSAQ
jgi:ParB/RepB/Spo0J family partition protein